MSSEDYSEADAPEENAEAVVRVSAEGAKGERVDRFLAQRLAGTPAAASRSRIQRWIALGSVVCDDRPISSSTRLAGFETFAVTPLPDEADSAFEPDPVPLSIVYRSPDLIVIDKPAGLVVHPAAGNWRNTLLNGLLYLDPDLGRLPRAGIVHRLDKDTSGLMVVAASERAASRLAAQLAARTMSRRYLAFVHGLPPESGCVDAPIGRDPAMRLRMAVVQGAAGKPARTHFRRLATFAAPGGAMTLVECKLDTGRTHQIRVHLSSIGYPIAGDELYGGRREAIGRQALHAWRLGLVDPATEDAKHWVSVPPADMAQLARSGDIDLQALCERLDAEIGNAR